MFPDEDTKIAILEKGLSSDNSSVEGNILMKKIKQEQQKSGIIRMLSLIPSKKWVSGKG